MRKVFYLELLSLDTSVEELDNSIWNMNSIDHKHKNFLNWLLVEDLGFNYKGVQFNNLLKYKFSEISSNTNILDAN